MDSLKILYETLISPDEVGFLMHNTQEFVWRTTAKTMAGKVLPVFENEFDYEHRPVGIEVMW